MKRLVFLVAIAACGEREINGTACTTATDCNLFNAQGTCEPTGFCSYPDPACLSGQRYAPGAGDGLANSCVGDGTCGARDQACCQHTVCADNLVCAGADTTMTCQCGALDQPCCDGTTCSTGLYCGATGTCTSGVVQVAVGAGHVCALLTDDSVWCWGTDVRGIKERAAVAAAILSYDKPTHIAGLATVAELRAGEFHTCAKKTDGTLWCWGHGEAGQLGDGTFVSSPTPKQVMGLSNVTMFDVGRHSACAVGTVAGNTRLYCWGRGGLERRTNAMQLGGRLGNGSVNDANTPTPVDLSMAAPAGQTVKAISVGGYHSCMVMSDDTVWCWGRNDSNQLGDGTTTRTMVPIQAVLTAITIPSGVTIDEVSVSDGRRKTGSTCIRLSDGVVHCWGLGTNGDLGDGTIVNRPTPGPVSATEFAGNKPVDLVAGHSIRCARMDNGDVYCWGENRGGVVGNGGMLDADFPLPQRVSLTGVTQVDASHHTACAIDGAKQLYCWGANRSGNATARYPMSLAEDTITLPFHIVF